MKKRLLLALSAISMAFFFYESALRTLLTPIMVLPDLAGGIPGQTLILVVFSLSHSMYALGWRNTLVFFGSGAVISWVYEQIGVATGIVFGAYHYTEVLGPKLGFVPLLIPLAWFMMIYPSYVIANLVGGDRPTGSPKSLGGSVLAAVLSGMVMTAWDVVMDPLMSGPRVGAWVWENGGPYFGIPLRNFAGWMLTTFTVFLVYRLFERRLGPQPAGPVTGPVAAMPLVAYGSVMISSCLENDARALLLIGLFAMGLPLLGATTRLVKK